MNARREIYHHLILGGKVSQLDCHAYEVEDMRTIVSHLKRRLFEDGYQVLSRWIVTKNGKRIKEYRAEPISSEDNNTNN